jgi:hypothetical protein
MQIEIIDGGNRPILIHLDESDLDDIKKAFQANESFFIDDEKGGQYIQIGVDLINRSFIRIIK